MSSATGGLEFSIAIVMLIFLGLVLYFFLEKKRKKDTSKKFRIFSENIRLTKKGVRTVPRIAVPDSLDVELVFTGNQYKGLKAHVVDMSLSGFCVKPDFSMKKLPLHTLLTDTRVVTPVSTFTVKAMKTVRIEQHKEKRLIAFHIEKIAEDQFDSLKKFMAYLDKFLKNKDNR